MRTALKYITVVCLFLSGETLFGQDNLFQKNEAPKFIVRGSVIESDTRNPIPNVNIEVNGGAYTTTDAFGDFRIQARKGDELTIRHKDFETVVYIIRSEERIKVEVEPNDEDASYSKLKRYSSSS